MDKPVLYGSLPSPYVRRIRLYMMWLGEAFDFRPVDVYDPRGRADYASVSPVRKLPVLVDEGQTIYDSRVIYQHLRLKAGLGAVNVAEHNLITVVDGVCDSLIFCFMAKRSGLEPSRDYMCFDMQYGRIETSLSWLEANVEEYREWGYPAMCLASLLDWMEFRELYSLEPFPRLRAFLLEARQREDMQATDPRLS